MFFNHLEDNGKDRVFRFAYVTWCLSLDLFTGHCGSIKGFHEHLDPATLCLWLEEVHEFLPRLNIIQVLLLHPGLPSPFNHGKDIASLPSMPSSPGSLVVTHQAKRATMEDDELDVEIVHALYKGGGRHDDVGNPNLPCLKVGPLLLILHSIPLLAGCWVCLP